MIHTRYCTYNDIKDIMYRSISNVDEMYLAGMSMCANVCECGMGWDGNHWQIPAASDDRVD
jgi:hypothetical protein